MTGSEWTDLKKKFAEKRAMLKNGRTQRDNGYGYTSKGYDTMFGTVENEPLNYYDENGQRVTGGSAIYIGKRTADGGLDTKSRDRLHPAYDTIRAETSDAIKRWNESRTDAEEESALKQLWQAYQGTGEFMGNFDNFKKWFKNREMNMTQGLLDVSALHNSRGIATKTADGRLTAAGLAAAKDKASGGGISTGGYEKQGNQYRSGGFYGGRGENPNISQEIKVGDTKMIDGVLYYWDGFKWVVSKNQPESKNTGATWYTEANRR